MKLVKLPEMSDEEVEEAIKNQKICRIGFIDKYHPYIAPFQYVYVDGNLYFHFTNYGKKKEILEKNQNVCVSIEQFEPDLSAYYFISIQGSLKSVTESTEIKKVINKMVEEARAKFSESFLSAHGFDKDRGWESFVSENQIIYKLDNIIERTALKSIH